MIRKLATTSLFRIVFWAMSITILAGVRTVDAQQTQTQSQPPTTDQSQTQPPQSENQQPSGSQEASPEELSVRKKKPKDYKNWTFNVGGGASATNGTTQKYVRSGGGIAAAGVARNFSKYFGFRLDFQWDNLPLRASALEAAEAPGATDHVYTLNLDPIINIPVTKEWGGYILGGPGFYHRSGKLDSSNAIPGSLCNGFFTWWGHCFAASLPLNGDFLHSSQNEFGENFGAGITRKIHSDIEFYAEIRYLHGKHNNITTDLRPITIGIRW
jgi:Outer membrane protein beta-barrel domain